MVDQQHPKVPDLPEIIGPSLKPDLDRLAKWKDLDEPILFTGETGTGKELFATYLAHHTGKPFYVRNCIGIPERLFESELFGHVAGAFTGATSNRAGLIETANNGTVFLDEIGDLPDSTLGKILRLIQFKEFQPVGSDKLKRANCRFLAATNKQNIREDLMERFTPFPLPSLRKRTEDIPDLLMHFLRKANYESITPLALLLLLEYPWPGNVRELEKACKRWSVERGGDVLIYKDVLTNLRFRELLDEIIFVEIALEFNGPSHPFMPDIMREFSDETGYELIELDEEFTNKITRDVGYFRSDVYEGLGIEAPYPIDICGYSHLAKLLRDPNYKLKAKRAALRKERESSESPFDEDPYVDIKEMAGEDFSRAEANIFKATTPENLKCRWLAYHLEKGTTAEKIAVKAGRSKATIYNWIKSCGLNERLRNRIRIIV